MSEYKDIFDAARNGTVEDIRYFVEQKGINVNVKYDTGNSPLEIAVKHGKNKVEIIKYLVSKGALIPLDLLMWAAAMEEGSLEIVKLFIEKGCDVNHRDSGICPLHLAASNKDIEVAKYLISKGADINSVAGSGYTPLQLAEKHGNTELVEYIKHKRGGCYVATCVYGSYDCPEVWTLRRYRDGRLSDTWFGRRFIQIYYSVSPKIVELFGNGKWFNGLCKPILNKFVRALQNSGVDSSPYSDM